MILLCCPSSAEFLHDYIREEGQEKKVGCLLHAKKRSNVCILLSYIVNQRDVANAEAEHTTL